MTDPVLYNVVNRRNQFSEATFTRWRARYRGQRESLKINSEIVAMLYNLRKLYEGYENIQATVDGYLVVLETGGTVAPISATPLLLKGVEDMSLRLDKLNKRVRSLEP